MSKVRKVIFAILCFILLVVSICAFLGIQGFQAGMRSLQALSSASSGSVREIIAHKNGSILKVLAIPAGSVSVKSCHAVGCLPEYFPYPFRFLAIVFDSKFGTTLPVWVYAIVHPEGVWLVDAGPSPVYYDDSAWVSDPVKEVLHGA